MTLIKFQKPGRQMQGHPLFPSVNSMLENFFNIDYNFGESMPAVNVAENDEEFKMEYLVPGFKKEEIKVNFENGVLTVSGEKKTENQEETARYTRKEFSHSSFKRSFTLPEIADAEKMNARYENGVLQITLPKIKPEVKSNSRVINIE